MSNKPDREGDWGFDGFPYRSMSQSEYTEMVKRTKLRTLLDMSEREIRALERQYGCPIIRPTKRRRGSTRPPAYA